MRKQRLQSHMGPSHERWLLTYSDLITLLLAFFVIMYAISNIDREKYTKMASAFGGTFGNAGKSVVEQKNKEERSSSGVPEGTERSNVERKLTSALTGVGKSEMVFVTQNERGVTVHILEETLFPSGQADLKPSALRILDKLARVIATLPNDVRIEGHTDDVPIHTAEYPSNWHLSVRRAVNTAYYLIEQHSLNPQKISVVGYAEFRPFVPNTSTANRAKNRRVDIVILTGEPRNDQAELPTEVMRSQQRPGGN